jgi:hypothetical protein
VAGTCSDGETTSPFAVWLLRVVAWLLIAVTLGVAVLPLIVATGAQAAPTASYASLADTKFGRHLLSLRQGVDAKAPASVPPNTRFTVAVSPDPHHHPLTSPTTTLRSSSPEWSHTPRWTWEQILDRGEAGFLFDPWRVLPL